MRRVVESDDRKFAGDAHAESSCRGEHTERGVVNKPSAEHSEGARVFPPSWNELLPKLDRQPEDVILTRRSWSAFAGTDLAALLKERGVTQIVLAGMATSFGVMSRPATRTTSATTWHCRLSEPRPPPGNIVN